jgi:oxygen-independent coproporphyrinogen-3 oxidase
MIAKAKHLYLHIPFCKTICAYCDFVRFVGNANDIKKYVRKLINDINTQCIGYKFKTIYVGGGTPNSLPNDLLAKILHTLNKYRANDCEFTIECNPEFLTIEQAITLKAYKVNRASIGAQTANNTILRKFHRQHTLKDVKQAISNLQKVGINNISIDLIYGFNGLTDNDIRQAIKFINIMHLSHVSWYALEVKSGSLLYKHKYKLHEEHIEHQLRLIIELMHKTGFHRYEVSS